MKTIKELEAEIKDLQIDENDFSSVGIEERLFEIDTLKDFKELIDEYIHQNKYWKHDIVVEFGRELKSRIEG